MTGVIVVGTGFGCRIQVPAFRAAGFDVVGIVGRDPDRTARRAARVGVDRTWGSLTEALRAPGTDLVAIATPPDTHGPLALEAIAAGRHVVCEKPFAADAAEARSMLGAAEDAGVVHMVGHEFRFATSQATMSRVLRSGAIGELRFATIVSTSPMVGAPNGFRFPDWWFDDRRGGGWLGASGSHSIDRLRTWLGEIISVSGAVCAAGDRNRPVDDSFLVHFTCDSGAIGSLAESGASWLPEPVGATIVVGSAGTAALIRDQVVVGDHSGRHVVEPDEDLAAADAADSEVDLPWPVGLEISAYSRFTLRVRRAIDGSSPSLDIEPATFVDGLAEMIVIDAIRRSAAAGGVVEAISPVHLDAAGRELSGAG